MYGTKAIMVKIWSLAKCASDHTPSGNLGCLLCPAPVSGGTVISSLFSEFHRYQPAYFFSRFIVLHVSNNQESGARWGQWQVNMVYNCIISNDIS